MIIKYKIENSKLYQNKLIEISSYSEVGKSLYNELKHYGYCIDENFSKKFPLYIKELDITITGIADTFKTLNNCL